MTKQKTTMKVVIFLLTLVIILQINITFVIYANEKKKNNNDDNFAKVKMLSDFELVEIAIIWQESKGRNPKVSDGQSEGIHQITPIYVNEVNRILGEKKYTLRDRLNPLKSHEMFTILQKHYNSDKNIKKAIRLHNGGNKYYNAVIDKFDFLKYYQQILELKNY